MDDAPFSAREPHGAGPDDEPEQEVREDLAARLARVERALRELQTRLDRLTPGCAAPDHARRHAHGERCPACGADPPS